MLNKTCDLFISELGSNAPVPGGGSAAALVGAVGIALGTMVGELTTGKKTYAEYEEEIQQLIGRSRVLTEKMKAAVKKDIESFKPLSDVYRMPNTTAEEKAVRHEAMQKALLPAAEAPLELTELCVEALEILDRYSEIGSRLAVSDAATGSVMCLAALKSARLNVIVNTKMMEDDELRNRLDARADEAMTRGSEISRATYERVENKLIG